MTTKAAGTCVINGVQAVDVTVSVDPRTSTAVLSAKYALLDIERGSRLGGGHRNTGWSDETHERLVELLASMERDICRDLFEEGATHSGADALSHATDGVPGL